jgi:hypothetical protein
MMKIVLVLRIIFVTTLLILSAITSTAAQDDIILFNDNFEGGDRSEWSFWDVNHEIVDLDGSRVLHIQSRSDWGGFSINKRDESNFEWSNYAVEARIKIISVDLDAPTPQFFLNIRDDRQGRNNYAGWLRFQNGSSGGALGGNLDGSFRGTSGVEQYDVDPQINIWHSIRLEANANEITWSLDDQTIWRTIDDEVTEGGVTFGIPPNVELYIDDVRVIELEAQDALVDERYANIDCTVPEPGMVSSLSVTVPASVNARSLSADTLSEVIALPQMTQPVVGWFDASGTPFAAIAGGSWLVLGDSDYTVKSSLVNITDATLVNLPQYQYEGESFEIGRASCRERV